MTTPNFELLYNMFMSPAKVKPITAQNFALVLDLFFAYGEKPLINQKNLKMVTELFLDMTVVFKKDEFVTIYDIFMGSIPKKDMYPIEMKRRPSLFINAKKLMHVSDENIRTFLDVYFSGDKIKSKKPAISKADWELVS
jgi:hypothetical protein